MILGMVGRELRLARVSAGQRQSDIAHAARTSTSRISRVERGRVASLSLAALARHAAAVGLRPYLNLYPSGRRLVDAPQLALLARLRQRLHASWTWETEVPMPIAGDLRAADCRISIPGCTVMIEAITRLADYQAQVRAARRKQRDLAADRLVLLVAASHANRRAVAEAGTAAAASFPVTGRSALRSLASGRDPGGDALILL